MLLHYFVSADTGKMFKSVPTSGTASTKGYDNFGHVPLDFCRVNANFSARVPKNLSGPGPPLEVVAACLKRGPRAQTRNILVPRAFGQMTDHESEGFGVENEPSTAPKF